MSAPNFPNSLARWMTPFAALFSRPTWHHALVLVAGTILTPGRRTVTAALSVMGLPASWSLQTGTRIYENRLLWWLASQRRAFLGMDSIASQFGAILRDLRTTQGLSQEELAFRAGMSVPYLSDLERGRSSPSLAMVVDLARALATHPSIMLADLIVEGVGAPSRRKRPKD